MKKTIVLSKYRAAKQYLVSAGIVNESAPWLRFYDATECAGAHIIWAMPGPIPMAWAASAEMVTEFRLCLPLRMKGEVLEPEDIAKYCTPPETYIVRIP